MSLKLVLMVENFPQTTNVFANMVLLVLNVQNVNINFQLLVI